MDRIGGIDPGLSGGIAIIEGEEITAVKMPKMEEVYRTLKELNPTIMYLEECYTIHGQGNISNFTMAKNYGILLGTLYALENPVVTVHPATWKSAFKLRGAGKEGSIKLCELLYPQSKGLIYGKRGGKYDGVAEALLIAHYGRGKESRALIEQVQVNKPKRRSVAYKQSEELF